MFERNDKSLNLVRKIINVTLFVLMCVSVIAGVVLIAMSFQVEKYSEEMIINFGTLIGGILAIILGPILLQIVWLVFDMKLNSILDVKIIRNAQYGLPAGELKAPLFFNRGKSKEIGVEVTDAYEKLRKYKALCDESVITVDEFEQIKCELLNKNVEKEYSIDEDIEKVKKLKSYVDDKIITEEEFAKEKSKILKK